MDRIEVPGCSGRRGFDIEWDGHEHVVIIDGVKFAPEVMLMITRPDPQIWMRLIRNDDDTVTAHQMFATINA